LRWEVATWKKTAVPTLKQADDRIVTVDHQLFLNVRGKEIGRILELATKNQVACLQLPPNEESPQSVLFSPYGDFIAAWFKEPSRVVMFETRTGKLLWSAESSLWSSKVFSCDGRWLAVQHREAEAFDVFDTLTGKRQTVLAHPPTELQKQQKTPTWAMIAVSPDGKLLATCVPGRNNVTVWSVGSGKKRFEVQCDIPLDARLRLAWSTDGRMLAVGGVAENHRIQVWEAWSGRVRLSLPGHGAAVTALAFSPDGRYLLSGSDDTTVLVWRLWN